MFDTHSTFICTSVILFALSIFCSDFLSYSILFLQIVFSSIILYFHFLHLVDDTTLLPFSVKHLRLYEMCCIMHLCILNEHS